MRLTKSRLVDYERLEAELSLVDSQPHQTISPAKWPIYEIKIGYPIIHMSNYPLHIGETLIATAINTAPATELNRKNMVRLTLPYRQNLEPITQWTC